LKAKNLGQEYGLVETMLGDGRVRCQCFDNIKRTCIIRGNMRHRLWIQQGDVILIEKREYQDKIGDVVHKFNIKETVELKKQGLIPQSVQIGTCEIDNGFEFIHDSDEETLTSPQPQLSYCFSSHSFDESESLDLTKL